MTGSGSSVQVSSVEAPRRYYGWALILFIAGIVAGFAAMSGSGFISSLGALLYFSVYISLLVLNWNGFVRAIAAHRWMSGQQGQASGCIVVFLYLVIVPYVLMFYPLYGVFQYGRGYLAQRKQYPLEHRRRVAELEAQLGIEPRVDGHCPKCGKPLQIGAEFCSFCGTRVIPEIRVCPKCGTVSLPGAEWCAKCGNALGPATDLE